MPGHERHWSLRTRRHIHALRSRGAPPPVVQAAKESHAPKTPWLSEAEELLNAVLSLVWRAGGSISIGVVSLYRGRPTDRLEQLEKGGHVLSWATLLVVVSAAFSALLPLVFTRYSPRATAWLSMALTASDVREYLDRLLPTLAVGLLTCLVASLPDLARGRLQSALKVRLLASHIFAAALVSSLVAAVVLRYVIDAVDGGRLDLELLSPAISEGAAGLVLLLVCGLSVAAPVCIATMVAAWRACLDQRDRPANSDGSWQRMAAAAVAAPSAALVPIAIFGFTVAAIALLGPRVDEFRDFSTPERLAEFTPLTPMCELTGNGPEASFTCTLTARTAGKGVVFLDLSKPAIVLSDYNMHDEKSRKFPLQGDNAIEERVEIDYKDESARSFEADKVWKIETSFPTQRAGDVVVVELGKPLVATVGARIASICEDLKLKDRLDGRYQLMYLRVKPFRTASESSGKAYAAIGPWNVYQSLKIACTEAPLR